MRDLDHILANDPVIEPSAGFAARVMGQVRKEAKVLPPLEFPWRRFLPGAITCAALVLVSVIFVATTFEPTTAPADTALQAAPVFDLALLNSAPALGAAALLGSLLLAWMAIRFTSAPRRESF